MMPKEVRELVKKLVKETINEELYEVKNELIKTKEKVNELEKEILIQKEGDNI